MQTYSMKLKTDNGQGDKWDFPITQEILKTSAGVPTDIHAVIRTDTGEMVGQYSDEKATAYPALVAAFEGGLIKYGAGFTSEKAFVTNNGGRFFADYHVGNVSIKGESFACYVRLLSSHNGTQKAGFQFFIKRLVCLNGMMLTDKVFAFFKRHAKNLDLGFLETEIRSAITTGESYVAESIGRMLAIPLDTDKVSNICSNLFAIGSTKGASERAVCFMHHNWCNPSADEAGLGNNLYRLYNAATRWTRDVERLQRFEMASKANTYISGALDLAARGEHNLNRLLAIPSTPIKFSDIIIDV